ncbi:MAG: A24 family peptidase [Clostridia bacterium]
MIIGYIVMFFLAIILGQIVAHLNVKLPPVVSEEITYKEFFKTLKKGFKIDIKYSVILLCIFEVIMLHLGNTYISYVYAILVATLTIVFYIDYKFQLIPDEAHIVIVILAIINLLFNLSLWKSYLFGAIIGGGIFYVISLLSLVIFKKEGMGFGDVKLMASLGLLFGIKNILVITLVSFFLGAIIGSILMILNRKKASSYIAFGPFIVISIILVIFVKPDYIINLYILLCTSLSTFVTDIIFNLSKLV